MPFSSAKTAETTSYDVVRTAPFTSIHQCPLRHDYKTARKEASNLASKVDNLTFVWSQDPTTEEEYGLLAEIIGKVKYTHLTNLVWIQEVELPRYDPAITNTTPTHKKKCMEDEWEEKHKLRYIQKGFLCGITINKRDVIDKQYYSQLKNINTAYCNTTLIQIFVHLNTSWCPLDVQARKILKKEFYTNWDSNDIHITDFWHEAGQGAEPTRPVGHHHQQQQQVTVLPQAKICLKLF